MKLPFNLMQKPYIRKQKTPMDKVMAGIAVYKYLSEEYPSTQEIAEACQHQKLIYTLAVREALLAEFPDIELPEVTSS